MKTFLKKACTVLLAGALLVPSLATESKVFADESKLPSGTPTAQIGQKIEDYVDQHKDTTAGMATAVFDKNGLVYKGNFGYIDKEKKIAVTDDTVFEWGSVTKLTVWVSVMQLWEEGKIDLEEDVRNYLPKGFLKRLNFDKPITMLDLMNHQAGFEEATTDTAKGKTMEEALSIEKYQPNQAFAPKAMTSYSNYGTALASHIVERISGQSFTDYAHQHIFKPLGMTKTALSSDLSDNDYVFNKHKEVKGYTTQGEKLADIKTTTPVYPVGMATGTLSDLARFGQALVKQEAGVLFKRAETWTTLFTATSYYGDTDTPRNSHGFWHEPYENGVSTIGHGGNTAAFTANLVFDPVSGIGMAILVNQKGEQTYARKMPELVYGQLRQTPTELKNRLSPGTYVSPRNFTKGPLSIISGIYLMNDLSKTNKGYAVPYRAYGRDKIALTHLDQYKVSTSELVRKMGAMGAWLLALVYALATLLVGLGLAIYRRIKKKESKLPKTWRVWHAVNAGLISLTSLNLFLYLQDISNNSGKLIPLYSMLFLALLILFVLNLVWALISRKKFTLSKGQMVHIGLTGLAIAAVLINILYWSLYQFWLLG